MFVPFVPFQVGTSECCHIGFSNTCFLYCSLFTTELGTNKGLHLYAFNRHKVDLIGFTKVFYINNCSHVYVPVDNYM